ncbi:FlgO family outer membrane protein [Pseudoalteromonas aliena]|uniref:FlgO family outer membrane protein n=1 Tax=Pseudoalteromonas aliena TaxID=247523 RepID=UPI0031204E4B
MVSLTKSFALISITFLSILLTGCNLLSKPAEVEPEKSIENNFSFEQIMAQVQNNEQEKYDDPTKFMPNKHHKTLASYVEQMALKITDNMQVSPENTAIAVTSFVDLDSSLNTASQLGNQLSETFMNQLQKFGYTAVDIKTADLITVSNQGDFAFTRDAHRLTNQDIASHVLSGTLIYRENGVVVNARVINIQNKRLAASSRIFIPFYVLNKEDIYLSSN